MLIAIPGEEVVVGMVAVPSRPAVVRDGQAGSPRDCRIEAPDRLLRVWALLSASSEELHKVSLPPAALPRLQRQLRAATAELQRSVSPTLAAELGRLVRCDGPPTAGELRIEYASLLGWTGGLVISMLEQLEQGLADVETGGSVPGDGTHPRARRGR
jgi:hypothetical protein